MTWDGEGNYVKKKWDTYTITKWEEKAKKAAMAAKKDDVGELTKTNASKAAEG